MFSIDKDCQMYQKKFIVTSLYHFLLCIIIHKAVRQTFEAIPASVQFYSVHFEWIIQLL